MKFPRVVTDNIQELLSSKGMNGVVNAAENPREFFGLLKQKILEDFDRLTAESDAMKKVIALADIQSALDEYEKELRNKLGDSVDKTIKRRKETMGSYSKRLILNRIQKDDSMEVEEILAYGKANGFPSMVFGRDEYGKVYESLLEGEGFWDGVIRRRMLGGSAKRVFEKLLIAVRNNDINRHDTTGV